MECVVWIFNLSDKISFISYWQLNHLSQI